MTATTGVPTPATPERGGEPGAIAGWLTSTDHKRIAGLTLGTALVMMLIAGGLATTMRAQLARPDGTVLSAERYDQFFTMHGSMMIYLVMTPFAIGAGLYFVPLQIGAPNVAAPRTTMLGYWLYLVGGLVMLSGFATDTGAADQGWYSYPPLASARYTPGPGVSLWIAGVGLSATGLLLMGATVLWTALLKRAKGMSMLRMPMFSWSIVATNLMVLGAFPALIVAVGMLAVGRINPDVFDSNVWNIGYQNLFWFFGHPVVYVMFFPFVGMVAEVLAVFAQRRFFGYRAFVLSQLTFAAFSMSVWGHHMFSTGQSTDYYYSLTSILLVVPAGIEYFDLVGTVLGGRLRFPTPMLFALAFLPQFLIGGLTGIIVATPALDYQLTDSYFIVAHWHYTLAAGSSVRPLRGHLLLVPEDHRPQAARGARQGPLLALARRHQPDLPADVLARRAWHAPAHRDLPAPGRLRHREPHLVGRRRGAGRRRNRLPRQLRGVAAAPPPAGDDPWGGHSLEWATSSPPPRYNFTTDHPLPPVRSYAPLLDLRASAEEAKR